jgi:hypothetical protein
LEQCINESVLYAEQGWYEHLKNMGKRYNELRSKQGGTSEGDWQKMLCETLVELSKPVRKKLGLKKINLIED